MTLLCYKCDHVVSQVTHVSLEDGALMKICTRCEVELDDNEWDLPEDLVSARKAGYRAQPWTSIYDKGSDVEIRACISPEEWERATVFEKDIEHVVVQLGPKPQIVTVTDHRDIRFWG